MKSDSEQTFSAVAGLGHVGLYCNNPEQQLEFYSGVLGLHITDRDDERKMYFLSARPEEEHHELLLVPGRSSSSATRVIQQLSFYCPSIDALLDIYKRLLASTARIDVTVTHGNALSVYYYDPENNRSEVYWPTGLAARQPFYKSVDLSREPRLIV